MTTPYPEIEQLKSLVVKHHITVHPLSENYSIGKTLKPVELKIGDESFIIHVNDEYNDLIKGNNLLNFYLILYSLDDYTYSKDLISWSKEFNLDLNNSVIEYYRNLGQITRDIERLLGSLSPCINNLDYELCSGAFQYLQQGNV